MPQALRWSKHALCPLEPKGLAPGPAVHSAGLRLNGQQKKPAARPPRALCRPEGLSGPTGRVYLLGFCWLRTFFATGNRPSNSRATPHIACATGLIDDRASSRREKPRAIASRHRNVVRRTLVSTAKAGPFRETPAFPAGMFGEPTLFRNYRFHSSGGASSLARRWIGSAG